MAQTIGSFLGVEDHLFAGKGILNTVIGVDTHLFLDPWLLKTSSIPEFKNSYEKLTHYFTNIVTLLSSSSSRGDFKISYGHYSVIDGPEWTPDCKHAALSIWQSGTSWLGEGVKEDPNKAYATSLSVTKPSDEGIYLYNAQTQKTTRIYKAKEGQSIFQSWKDNNVIIFVNLEKTYYLDINTLEVTN